MINFFNFPELPEYLTFYGINRLLDDMGNEFYRSLFIFRRDLRLYDNTSLLRALEKSDEVIPVFIFDPILMDKDDKNYNAIQFMMESLDELDRELRSLGCQLYYFYTDTITAIEQIQSELQVDAVFCNIDYSPYARKRAKLVKEYCENTGIEFVQYSDYPLVNPEAIYTQSGDRYQVFSYYYRKASEKDISKPKVNDYSNYYSGSIKIANPQIFKELYPKMNSKLYVNGGRSNAISVLNSIDQFKNYDQHRDYPAKENGTTHLSAHLKFGTVSVREVYHQIINNFSKDHSLIRQLFWRDFYIYLSVHYNYVFHRSFKKKYDRINWKNNNKQFERWCLGRTGFPIIDAGMRQLNETGYMHNRVRMIVVSFLAKDLHINWQRGEQYFAQKLVDYDVMVNNGNWQWASSTGADAQPYFRIFNPWTQQKKYDNKGEYIKRYVEELEDISVQTLHKLHSQHPKGIENYPEPIVDHKSQAEMAKQMFKKVL